MATYDAIYYDTAYSIASYGAPSVADTTPPTVTNVSPTAGSALAPGDYVQFDVTDSSGSIAKLIVTAAHGGLNEVVYEESAFRAGFSERSTAAAITNGFRFTVYRFSGWKGAVVVRVHAVDSGGNEST